jgi:hypothetical protein
MDLIPDAEHPVRRTITTKPLVQAASVLALAACFVMPMPTQAQDSAAFGGTSLGSGLGSSSGGLAVSAPLGGGYGIGGGVLQNTALGGPLVNLRDLVNSPIMQPSNRAFNYFASLGVFGGYTDNTALSGYGVGGTGGGASLFARVNPTVGATLDLTRIQASGNYAPSFNFYSSRTAADSVTQALNGQILVTAVPELLFVRASVFGTVASTSQLSGYNGITTTTANNSTQVYGYSVSPYATHPLGDSGSIYAAYTFSENYFSRLNNSAKSTSSNVFLNSLNNTNSGSQSEVLSLSSGSTFDHFQHEVTVQASQIYGNNMRNVGDNSAANYTLRYALSPFWSFFGSVGYQERHYNATSIGSVKTSRAYNYHGPSGSGGVTYTPNDLGSLTMSYGYSDGSEVFSALGRLQPTPRLTFLANSSTGVTTNGQDLSAFTGSSGFAASGGAAAPVSGAPSSYVLGTTAGNPAPYRLTRSSVSTIFTRDLDSFSASVSYSEQSAVASVNTTPVGSSRSVLGSIGWQHTVSDDVMLSTNASYGQQYSGATSTSSAKHNPVIGASARLSDQLSPTLSAEIDYIFQHQQSYNNSLQSQNATSMNEIYAGFTKRF